MKRVEDTRSGTRVAAWHLVTSEYPPQTGGVSDYTRLVAEGLAAAGDEVHVWCPSLRADESLAGGDENEGGPDEAGASLGRGVSVHRELGDFSPSDLLRAGRLLDGYEAPRRLLVQYVPHGYGWRSMNIAFCLWLWKRAALGGDAVEIIVHEPFLAFGEGTWRQSGVAAVHRLLTTILLRAPVRVWATIPAWVDLWRPYAPGRRVEFAWLPVPSTVPVVADASAVASRRARYVQPGGALIGHFGTYPREVAGRLLRLLPSLLSRDASVSALLIGRGGEAVRDELAGQHPLLAARIHASGVLPPREVSFHLAACDLLVQPFPDGVSSRRTSVMAALAHGLPVVTTEGRLTEPLWAECGAVALAPVEDPAKLLKVAQELLADAGRGRMGAAAKEFYRERFDLKHTIDALRGGRRQRAGLDA